MTRRDATTQRDANTTDRPRCPVCRHLLRDDGAEGWICSARGGCGSEFAAEHVEQYREVFYT